MKKYFFLKSLLILPFLGFSQGKDTISEIKFDNQKLLKGLSDNACKCVDSLSTYGKSRKDVAAEIHACIDKQVMVYQMGMKLASIKNITESDKGPKNINITINTNSDSQEYKKYYYEIERSMMENCEPLKIKIATNDEVNDNSMTNNPEAFKYYKLGLEVTTNGDYAKAIEYYKKAVVFDPEFSFAFDNMGICYRRLNKFDEAIDAYENSLKINPNGKMPLQNIAVVYTYKEEYKKAVKAYERLAKVEPNNPEVFFGIGNIYAQALFDYEKALENLCQAYNLYLEQKSPYRSDAEKLIQIVYNEMKKQGKVDTFNEILKKYHIAQN